MALTRDTVDEVLTPLTLSSQSCRYRSFILAPPVVLPLSVLLPVNVRLVPGYTLTLRVPQLSTSYGLIT